MKMHVEFDRENGNIIYLGTQTVNFIAEQTPLFKITLMDDMGDFHTIDSLDARSVSFDESAKRNNKTYDILFAGFEAFDGLSVIANILFDVDGKIYWRISINNNTDQYIEKIQYPCITVPNDLVGEGKTARLLLPCFEGALIEKISDVYTAGKHYPGFVNMQFIGYYDHEAGLYFAAEDPAGTPKIIDCIKTKNGNIELVIAVYVSGTPHSEIVVDFPLATKCFSGEWEECADIYRDYVESSNFPLPERIYENKALPDWHKKSSVIIIYPVRNRVGDKYGPNEYMPYINSLPYLQKFSETFDVPVMALLMGWEGSVSWAPPYIWPPYGGREAMAEFISKMHESGNYVGLYASGINWADKSRFTDDFDNTDLRIKKRLNGIMCKLPNQEPDPERGNAAVRSGYHMCPYCQQTKDITLNQIEGILDAGIDYLQYFDQNLGGGADKCYAKDHGHVPLHGRWSVDSMKSLYSSITKMIINKGQNCVIGTECAPADCFLRELPFNDNRYIWVMMKASWVGMAKGHSVPAFQYVFHEYMINFMGNQCGFTGAFKPEKNDRSLHLRLAYSFIAGDLLTFVLKSGGEIYFDWDDGGERWMAEPPDQKSIKKLSRNLCDMRKGAGYKYLHTGRMIKADKIIDPPRYTLHKENGDEVSYPLVLTSKWTFEGNTAQIFVNYSDKPQTIRVSGKYKTLFDGSKIYPAPDMINGVSVITVPELSALGAGIT